MITSIPGAVFSAHVRWSLPAATKFTEAFIADTASQRRGVVGVSPAENSRDANDIGQPRGFININDVAVAGGLFLRGLL